MVHRIDANDRLIAFDAAFRYFAIANGAPGLCEEWLGPAHPNAVNQHIDRDEILALASLCPTPRVSELRARIAAAAEPDLALPEGDTI